MHERYSDQPMVQNKMTLLQVDMKSIDKIHKHTYGNTYAFGIN